MKLKLSFVTNSSTTSFVFFGFQKSPYQIKENEVLMGKISDLYKESEEDDFYNLKEALNTYLKQNNSRAQVGSTYDDKDELFIGIHPRHITLDETRRDVLISIINDCFNLLNIQVTVDDFHYIEEAWRDG
jgi:hypothetical protein